MKTINLCKSGCCPQVIMGKDHVKIGEEPHFVKLNPEEWNSLVEKVHNGELHKL